MTITVTLTGAISKVANLVFFLAQGCIPLVTGPTTLLT
jgi:hypothetical protein